MVLMEVIDLVQLSYEDPIEWEDDSDIVESFSDDEEIENSKSHDHPLWVLDSESYCDDEKHESFEVFRENLAETPSSSKILDVDAMYMKAVYNHFKNIYDPVFENIMPHLENYTEDENRFLSLQQFERNLLYLTIRLKIFLQSSELKEITMLLNCNIILAPQRLLCSSFMMRVILAAIYWRVEHNVPDTLQICMRKSQHLSIPSNKILLSLIAHDVGSLKGSFKMIRKCLVYVLVMLPRPDELEDMKLIDNIIPSIHKIYMDLIYDPETIEEITDPQFVEMLLRLLNAGIVDRTDRHSILEILAIMACNSEHISQILMKPNSVGILKKFLGKYKLKASFRMDFASLVWAILPPTPYSDTRTQDMHEKMREEMIQPYRVPIWYWETSEGFWIPFTPGLNYEIEKNKHNQNQGEFLYTKSGIFHTINFKELNETNEATGVRKAIRRDLTGYCGVLPLRKTKSTRSSVSNCFTNFAYDFFCGRIYNTFNNGPEKYQCWEGLCSLFKFLTVEHLSKLRSDRVSWAHDLLFDECFYLRILGLEMVSNLMSKNPKKYKGRFENKGIMTAIIRIAQASEVPSPSDVEDQQCSFDTLEERTIWLRDQARQFLKIFGVKDMNVPKIGSESTMSDLEKIPISILYQVLISTPSRTDQPKSGRLQVLRYFIHFLTSTDGPKDRQQRLEEFLELFANIPQNTNSKDLQIKDDLFCKLLTKLTAIVHEFLHSKTPWPRRLHLLDPGKKTLRKLSKCPLNIDVYNEIGRICFDVPPFTTVRDLGHLMLEIDESRQELGFADIAVDDDSFRAEIHMNGKRVPSDITIYEAVRRFGVDIEEKNIFRMTHRLEFVLKARCDDQVKEFVPSKTPLEHHLRERSPCPEIPEDVRMALQFIDILYGLNEYWTTLYSSYDHQYIIRPNKFISNKWWMQIDRMLMNPFSIFTGKSQSLVWHMVENCPFALSLQTRKLVFNVCLERLRALRTAMTQYFPYTDQNFDPSDYDPSDYDQRVKVRRSMVLSDIHEALRVTGYPYANWDVTFKGEIGSGEGLKGELFTAVSRNLQRADLHIWAASEATETGYIKVDAGLYPAASRKVNQSGSNDGFLNLSLEDKFHTIGRFLGKALLDGHTLDLPLALPIFKCLLNQENWLNLEDLKYVNPSVYKVLKKIEMMAEEYEKIKNEPYLTEDAKNYLIKKINVDGETVDSYYLDFVVPGEVSIIELIPNGANIPVTLENAPSYVEKVKDFLLKKGVEKQMDSLKTGFDSMINLDKLIIFRPEELITFIYGEDNEEYWSIQHMKTHVKIDGFEDSGLDFVFDLFKLWSSMSTERRLLFLQFITGCSRLPVGGFASLNPPLRISSCAQGSAYAQTCFNRLILPFSMTKTQLEKFVDLAISEGLNYFGIV